MSANLVHTAEHSDLIGDPVSSTPVVPYEKLEEVFDDIRSHVLYDHELHGCLNCGICTATCPSAHYYDYSPREIVQLLWTENLEGIYDAMQEKIWACAQCYTCAARCPFGNSPGGLVMIMREIAHQARHAVGQRRAAAVLSRAAQGDFDRQPARAQHDHARCLPAIGDRTSPRSTPRSHILRKAIPVPTMHTMDTAWEVNLKTSVELYSIWEATGVLDQLGDGRRKLVRRRQ